MSRTKKHTRPVIEEPKLEEKPKPKLKDVKSGQKVILGDGLEYQYLDVQTRTSRGESLTQVFFRKMSDNTMAIFKPDDKALDGFNFIKP